MTKNQGRKACDGGLDPKWLSLKPVNQEIIMSKLRQQYPEFYEWLMSHVNQRCREALQGDLGQREADNALAAWLNDIHPDGHIEIPGGMTEMGRPVVGSFPELAE